MSESTFTSEDYEAALMVKDGYVAIPQTTVLAALRIAARATKPGLIEDAFMTGMRQRGAGKEEVAAAIRRALCE